VFFPQCLNTLKARPSSVRLGSRASDNWCVN
jgi:hypothetical protein